MAQVRPFLRVEPGGQISAAELNRAFDEIVRQSRITVAAPLQITEDWQGKKIRIDIAPAIHIRITGRAASGSGSTAVPAYFYSGVEQWSYLDGSIVDAPTGQHFFSNLMPLVEMSENPNIPVDAIAVATRAASGDHWEFLWEGNMGSGSGSGGGDCTKCCCCCIPCKGPIWFYWPGQPGPDPVGFGVDYPTECFNRQCADRPDPLSPCGPIFMPAMMLQPEFDPDTIGDTYPRCWSCSGESPWIVGLAKVGDVSYGTINLSIKVCCDGPKHCPILTIRGTYTVNAIGASNMNVAEGTYEMCIGPVASDPSLTFNCHQRNNDDPSGPQDWQAGWLSTTLNDCDDTNFFGCPCHTQFGGDVTIRCGINTCERTGIPQSGFPVRMSDTGILYCGDQAIGDPGITGFMTPHVGFFPAPFVSNTPCGLYWTGQVTTKNTTSGSGGPCPDSSGCVIDILLMLLEDGSFALQLLSDSGSGTTCGTLVNGILAGDFHDAPSFAVSCNPFCMTITWSAAAHMYFGDCA